MAIDYGDQVQIQEEVCILFNAKRTRKSNQCEEIEKTDRVRHKKNFNLKISCITFYGVLSCFLIKISHFIKCPTAGISERITLDYKYYGFLK